MPDHDVEVGEILQRFGGLGEGMVATEVEELWQQYSTDLCATWLLVDDLTFGGFCGWLAGKVIDSRSSAQDE